MSLIRTCRTAVMGLTALLCSFPASAGIAELRAALAGVPAVAVMKADALLAGFIDLSDLRRLPAFAIPNPPRLTDRLYPAVSSDTVRALIMNDIAKTEAKWLEKTGVAMSDVSSFLVFGQPPVTATVWQLGHGVSPQVFLSGLETRGFARSGDGDLSNGEPMTPDFTRRDEANPFAGPLGRASTLGAFAGGVVQSANPRVVTALRMVEGPGFGSLDPVAAALDAIEKVFGDARLPQATILGIGAWTPDVAGVVLQRDPSAAPRLPEPGAPPAAAAIVADIEAREPARRGTAIAIGYPDCATAAKASASFSQSWREVADRGGKTPRERTGAEPVTQEVESAKGCAAIISLTIPAKEGAGNPVYRYVLDSLMRRDLKALQGK